MLACLLHYTHALGIGTHNKLLIILIITITKDYRQFHKDYPRLTMNIVRKIIISYNRRLSVITQNY